MRPVLHLAGRAIVEWNMIRPQDRLAVGLSGGKDSTILLRALAALQKSCPVAFHLEALHVDLGWATDLEPMEKECRQLNIPLHVEKTQIARIVFSERREKNPCALCSHMRRGALCNAARKRGLYRVALAHHLDDAAETLLLNLFFTGRIKTFPPVSYLSRSQVTVIRPLLYVSEALLSETAQSLGLEPLENPCPAAHTSQRRVVKGILEQLAEKEPRVRQHILAALHGRQPVELWKTPPTPGPGQEESPDYTRKQTLE